MGVVAGPPTRRVGEDRVHHLVEGLPGVDGDRPGCSHHIASSVNHPRKPRVVVCVDGRQAAAGKQTGDRGLSCAGTACDLDSAH